MPPAIKQGEKLATTLRIDVSSVLEEFPNALFSLVFHRNKPDEAPYIGLAAAHPVEGIVEYRLASADTGIPGLLRMECQARENGALVKDWTFYFNVVASLGCSGAPDPDPSIIDQMTEIATDAANARDVAVGAADRAETAADDAIAAAMSADEDAQSTAADREIVESLAATVQSNKDATDANVATTAALRDETKQYADVAEAYFITRVFAVDDETGHVIQLASGDADNLAFAIPSNGHMEVTIGA